MKKYTSYLHYIKYYREYITFRRDRFLNRMYLIKGGGNKFNINYKEINLEFERFYDDGQEIIYISNIIDGKKTLDCDGCITIQIDKKLKQAVIQGVTTNIFKCFEDDDFQLKNPGNFYIKLAIKFLIKYKNKFGIKQIQLTDNAMINCHNKKFNLSDFLYLTKGHTFYGKFGFEPKDEDDLKRYKFNLKLINKIKMKDFNFPKMIKKIEEKEKEIKKIKIWNHIKNILLNKKYNENKFINIIQKIFTKNNSEDTCMVYYYIKRYLIKRLEKYGYEFLDYKVYIIDI